MKARLAPEQRTIPALLSARAEERPDAPFVHDDAGTVTWGAALELARSHAAGFAELGIGRGETVGVMLENRREFLAAWFGLAFCGAVEVPVNPANARDRLVHQLNTSRCSQLVVQAEFLPQLEAVATRLPTLERVLVVGDGASDSFESLPFGMVAGDPGRAPDAAVQLGDASAVMFTSGSTGPAKGVVVSHGQHCTNGQQPTLLFDIGSDDTVYVCLPLHHNMAQGYGVCVGLVSGAAVRLAPRFDAERFWDDAREHAATVLSFVGAMLVLLAKQAPKPDDDQNPLRVGFGVPIPADLHKEFERRFGMRLVHCYGSTEATIVTWGDATDSVPGSAGRPLPEFEVRVMDEADMPVAAGVVGEICVRPGEPYSMFSGYLHDPESTVKAWRNLWFHTGDRGWFDDAGELRFADRKGDVIRRMGEFVSSYEVEQVVTAHPDVQLAAAFGVPSELIEEEVMIAVVPQPGSRPPAAALRAWCAERLPRHAVPRFVEFMEELPMTPSGKIEKFQLRSRGVTASTDDGRSCLEQRR